MVANLLQKDFIADLQKIFKGYKLKNSRGELTEIEIYQQYIPIDKAGEGEAYVNEFEEYVNNDESRLPLILVYVHEGEIGRDAMDHEVDISLAIGVYDNGDGQQGYQDLINIMGKIEERYVQNDILAKKYIMEFPIKWKLQEPDEETWPCYYGAMFFKFMTATYRKGNRYPWVKN